MTTQQESKLHFNYNLQVWVKDGICQPCNHDNCNDWPCAQRINAGLTEKEVEVRLWSGSRLIGSVAVSDSDVKKVGGN
jgi:hypothetical protein